MPTNVWTGTGEWNTDLTDWSAGVAPTSGQNIDLEGDDTLNGTGVGRSMQVGPSGSLTTGASASLTLSGYLADYNSGLQLHGHVSVAGNFVSGLAVVTATTTATSVSFANLMSQASLDIVGGTAQALVTVNGAPTDGFSGSIQVSGNARLAYAGTGGAIINADGSLELDGAAAGVTFAGASAVGALATNYGALFFRGGTSSGAGGVAFTTSGGFLNVGTTAIDDVSGSGGSQVTVNGALIVAAGTVTIGNAQLSAATAATAASLQNEGKLVVAGDTTTVNPLATTLTINSAAPTTLTGEIDVDGDAQVKFNSGGVSSLQYAATVSLQSGGALLAIGAAALGGLTSNYGALDLENDALTVTTNLRNFAELEVDTTAPGGGDLGVQGTFSNFGLLQLGNAFIRAGDSMQIAKIGNEGSISVQGAVGFAAQSKLSVGSAASANLVGYVSVAGDGDIDFSAGVVSNVQAGSELDLVGASAQITNGAGSALQGLRLNYGLIDLRGDEFDGEGGAQFATDGAFRNAALLQVDTTYGDGGSGIQFGGAISNYSPPVRNIAAVVRSDAAVGSQQQGIFIGNVALDAATTVTGTSFLNEGYLDIQGSSSDEAMLSISGAANAGLTGTIVIGGDGALKYGSGGIANVQTGAQLTLIGANAQVLSGSQSALATLTSNFGKLSMEGNNSTYGAGGVTIAITAAFTNYGQILIDDEYGAYGSLLSIAGGFTNDGSVGVGPVYSTSVAPSTLQASALVNNASLTIGGASTGAVIVNGAASNNGALSIAAVSSLTVNSGGAFTQSGGETDVSGSLSATSVVVNGGKVDFKTALTADDVIGGFTIGIGGTLEFDGAVDSGRAVSFSSSAGSLTLNDATGFAGAISSFSANDFIHLTGLTVSSYAYAGNATAGVLMLQTSGGPVNLHFTGAYAKGSFLLVPDGSGGTYILRNLVQDIWTGYGDWDANLGDWSAGAAPAGKNIIVTSSSSLTASGLDKAGAVTLLSGSSLTAASTSTLTVTGLFNNSGGFQVNANNTTIAGALINNAGGFIDLDAASANTNLSLSAASLSNFGEIDLIGGGAPSGPTATLTIGALAPTNLTGTYFIENNATLAFGSGAITGVSRGAELDLYGAGAAIKSGAGSALSGLTSNYGTINVAGNAGDGVGGAALAVTGSFLNANSFVVDIYGGGGSQVSFSGLFTNTDSFSIGDATATHTTLVTIGSLNNEGALDIQGDDALAPTARATLKVNGAANPTLTGEIDLAGAATLQYASGAINTIQYGSSLELDGANAKLLTNNGAASALSGLASSAGTLNFEGDAGDGAGGVTQSLSSNFSNFSVFDIDSGNAGGSAVTVGGTFLNTGETTIGNAQLLADTTINVGAFSNQGSLILQGEVGGANKVLMNVAGNAAAAFTGQLQIGGQAELRYGGGGITTIQYGASLEVDGAGASLTAGGVSALKGLSVNAGDLILSGDSGGGGGGVTLTTTTGLTNSGRLDIDQNQYGGGGNTVTFGGAVVNSGEFAVGNQGLADDDLATMASLTNEGEIDVTGSSGPVSATVRVNSAATGALTGLVRLTGDATLAYASGGFSAVQAGASLTISGDGAILAGTGSALSTLTANYGSVDFEGGSFYGGALSVAIGQALTNYGAFSLDVFYSDGGDTLSIAGLFTNDGDFTLGNAADSAATTLTVNGVANNGTLEIGGATTIAGTLSSNANVVNRGDITINAGGVLDAGVSALIQYAGKTQVQSGGVVKAAGVDAFGGLIDFAADVTAGGSLGNFAINGVGTLEFDGSVDAGHAVTFGQSGGVLALGSSSAFAGALHGFGGNDAIDLLGSSVTSLAYSGNATSGTLNVQTSSGAQALHFVGNYTTASFTTLSDGAGGVKILAA